MIYYRYIMNDKVILMSEISERLLSAISEKGYSYGELSKLTGLPKSAIQRYATGQTEKIPVDRLEALASVLGVTSKHLMGWDGKMSAAIPKDFIQLFAEKPADNVIPMPATHHIPLIGTIACGDPILAQENHEGEVTVPEDVHADFALRCKGDSMICARIYDGDIVYIRQQETVDDGEIAAVLIDDEATLKRVRLYDDHVVLEPENPQYRPIVYWGIDMNAVRILGKAVAFTSIVR